MCSTYCDKFICLTYVQWIFNMCYSKHMLNICCNFTCIPVHFNQIKLYISPLFLCNKDVTLLIIVNNFTGPWFSSYIHLDISLNKIQHDIQMRWRIYLTRLFVDKSDNHFMKCQSTYHLICPPFHPKLSCLYEATS